MGHILSADGLSIELAIVHRDGQSIFMAILEVVRSDADHLFEGESWILPVLRGPVMCHVRT